MMLLLVLVDTASQSLQNLPTPLVARKRTAPEQTIQII